MKRIERPLRLLAFSVELNKTYFRKLCEELPKRSRDPARGNANADYVEALYRAILDRNADASGLAIRTNLLNNGTLSRLQVVQGIRNSPEHFTQEVTDFYLTLLGRAPDAEGLQNWVQQLEGGMREEEMAS
jgi:hypothetical protein